MTDDLDELRANLVALPDQQLVDMIHDQREGYRPEALDIARDELRRRGVNPGRVEPDAARATPEANPFVLWVLRQPKVVAAVGYLVFAAGTVLGTWLAWRAWEPQSDENPYALLVIVWVIAGISNIFVRGLWRVRVISAIGSALGYVVLVIALYPKGLENEMFAAGIFEVGLFGFVASILMGAPVAFYRRHSQLRGRA